MEFSRTCLVFPQIHKLGAQSICMCNRKICMHVECSAHFLYYLHVQLKILLGMYTKSHPFCSQPFLLSTGCIENVLASPGFSSAVCVQAWLFNVLIVTMNTVRTLKSVVMKKYGCGTCVWWACASNALWLKHQVLALIS
jgi:hypothetical protein